MFIEGIDPVLFILGPLVVRWYGLMFALSAAVGIYYLRKHGLKQGFSEDAMITLALLAWWMIRRTKGEGRKRIV